MTLNEIRATREKREIKPKGKEDSTPLVCPLDLEESIEEEFNKAVSDLHVAILLLEDWMDLGLVLSGKELQELLGLAYKEFQDLKKRTHSVIKEYDLKEIREAIEGGR
jgi:hypothetical protein